MFDPSLVVALAVLVAVIAGGVKISIGNINIGNRTKEKDDDR
ncbi:hypothetical protein ACJJIE_00085 (plasmid) [Microbulbifer sp. TRSA001]